MDLPNWISSKDILTFTSDAQLQPPTEMLLKSTLEQGSFISRPNPSQLRVDDDSMSVLMAEGY